MKDLTDGWIEGEYKGKLIGQRPPLKKQEIWSVRVRLQPSKKTRDLALFNLASTANCEAVTSLRFAPVIFQQEDQSTVELW